MTAIIILLILAAAGVYLYRRNKRKNAATIKPATVPPAFPASAAREVSKDGTKL